MAHEQSQCSLGCGWTGFLLTFGRALQPPEHLLKLHRVTLPT